MAPPTSSADRRSQFLAAVKNQKLDSVRWALTHGGQNPGTRDDDGFTAIHIAAASNKNKVLQLMLDICRRSRELELIDLRDGEGEEMTALMMAAANGFEACVRELLYAGAKPTLVCAQGLTAEGWARKRGHVALADLIARGGEDEEESEEEGGDEENGEETSTQRSRRKKRELAAFESRGAKLKAVPDEPPPEDEEGEEGGGGGSTVASGPPGDAPCWPEVARALEGSPKELLLERVAGQEGRAWAVDPALFRCASLNLLKLQLKAADAAAPKPLTQLPNDLRFLTGLRTLILSNNALESLPDVFGSLTGLKVFEAAFNSLTALPPSFAKLASLETLLLAHNALSSLAPLAPLGNLASVTLDANKLVSLDDMGLDRKPRLALLSVRGNALAALPASIGECALLAQVLARGNALRDVPYELCTLKKLRDLELEDNPIDDPKIKKMIQKPASFVKEITPYLKKRGKVAAPAPAAAKPAAPAAAAKDDSDSDDEAAAPAGRSISKKERAKMERKALEEKQKAATAAAMERAAAAAASVPAAAASGSDGDDSDDDEAMLARRKPAASFMYALDPAERDRLEKAEAEALRARREAEAAAEADKAKDANAKAEAETERKMRAASIKEAQADAGVNWAFSGGQLVKAAPGAPPPPGAPSGGRGRGRGAPAGGRGAGAPDIYDVYVEIPSLVVGRIIGKAGATIKEITARSSARVSVDSGAAGMSILHCAGRPEALESARMLINNALAPRAR